MTWRAVLVAVLLIAGPIPVGVLLGVAADAVLELRDLRRGRQLLP